MTTNTDIRNLIDQHGRATLIAASMDAGDNSERARAGRILRKMASEQRAHEDRIIEPLADCFC